MRLFTTRKHKNKQIYLSQIVEFYNIHPGRSVGYFRDKRAKEILDQIQPQHKKILDVGCGTGKLISDIKVWYPNNKFYGIDISPVNIQQAQKNINYAEFKVADVEQLPYSNNFFDILFCTDTLEHVYSLPHTLFEFNRVLKPAGLLIICCPNYFNFLGIIKLSLEKLHICPANSFSLDNWYQAHENFMTYFKLKKSLKNHNFQIEYLKPFNTLQGSLPALDFSLHKIMELYKHPHLNFLSRWAQALAKAVKKINNFLDKFILTKYFSSQMIYVCIKEKL